MNNVAMIAFQNYLHQKEDKTPERDENYQYTVRDSE